MPVMHCKCGKPTNYLEGMVGILSCPHCGEELADFGARKRASSGPIQANRIPAPTSTRPFDAGKPLATPHPIGNACPACGSTEYITTKPQAMVAYTDDRICKQCSTRYTPPTPSWARAVFGIVGIVASLFGLAMAVAAVTGGPISAGMIAVPTGMVGIGCLYKAFTA